MWRMCLCAYVAYAFGCFFFVCVRMLSVFSPKQDVAHLHDALVDDCGAAPDAAKGPLKLAYVTPERIIKSKVFLARLERAHALGRIAAFVVDEAHCCRYSVYWLYWHTSANTDL